MENVPFKVIFSPVTSHKPQEMCACYALLFIGQLAQGKSGSEGRSSVVVAFKALLGWGRGAIM